MITGLDLVEQMIRVAYGEKLAFTQDDVKLNGWSIETRVYAEDPYRNFLPSIGRASRLRPPAEMTDENGTVRVDTGIVEGSEISMFYDPMIAKLITWADTREAAIDRSEEHTSELQSLMRISYAVSCLTKTNKNDTDFKIQKEQTKITLHNN